MAKYYPKSQIKPNLYTKGKEYQYSNNKQEYKGYYYVTSQGQYYTGKHPGDLPNTQITLINPTPTPILDNTPTQSTQTSWTYAGQGYNKQLNNPPSIPKSIYPTPQDKDYKLGEFQRYFLSKTNESKFIEVNQPIYNQYLNQDPNVSYQTYTPINFSWELTGNREKVYKINLNTVQRVETNLQLRGFTQYFKERYDQFYKELG